MGPKAKNLGLCPTRENLINSLEKIKSILNKKSSSMTLAELETRASIVESIFSQLNNVQANIEQSEDASECSKRQFYEELYCEVKSQILNCISEHNRKQSTLFESSHNVSYGTPNSSIALARLANLPKLKVPIFSGKYTEWTNWFHTFISLINNDSDIDNLSKFVHLRSALGPIPLRTIESLEVTADNYTHALSLLKARFENKSIIFQAHIKYLFEIAPITRQGASSLRELIDNVNSHLRALQSLGSTEDVANVIIYYLIRSKVDAETLKKWEDQFKCEELPSWEKLSKFLSNRCTALENRDLHGLSSNLEARPERQHITKNTFRSERAKKIQSFSLAASHERQLCPSCKGNHILTKCSEFLNLSPLQRYFEVKKHSLCVLCLLKTHSVKECTAARCASCNGMHNNVLHRGDKRNYKNVEKIEPVSTVNQPEKVVSESIGKTQGSEVSVYSHSGSLYNSMLASSSVKFLATAVLLVRTLSGKFVDCRAILDSGSQLNFVTAEFANKLKLTIEKTQTTISGIGSAKTESLGRINAVIRSRLTNYSDSLQFLVIPSITQYSPNVEISEWHLPKNVDLADPKFNESRIIDMLLGVSTFFKLLSVGQISLGNNMPLLQKSLLGWMLAGDYKYSSNSSSIMVSINAVEENEGLANLVEKFWKCETINPICPKFTPEEQACENYFLATVQRTLSGRFIVRLPFKNQPAGVGESYMIALRRLEVLERKLAKNPDLRMEYKKFIEEYSELDHLECVSHLPLSNFKYFMPHHAVVRPYSLTTKLRVVFDASCKSSNGYSLNENLLAGPQIQPELFDILIRFRLYKYGLTADISKMYRQILVNEEDCNWQCILWRNERSKEVDILRLKTVTYGTRSAPYLAVRCLKFLAHNFKSKYPLGSQILENNMYMDDMLAGADTLNELQFLKKEITELLNVGRFELHKWRSSFSSKSQSFSSELEQEPLSITTEDCAKTLGIWWYAKEDTFRFSYTSEFPSKITKRIVLSELAQLFDPLGLLNPIIVLGKYFIQELWLLKLDWDESIPQNLHEKWQKYRNELRLVSELNIPRSVADFSSALNIELHGFSDASNRAFGCAIYLRVVDKKGIVSINLLAAKSKIAPLKSISLPRLELQGAVMLAQLMDRIKHIIARKFKSVFYWTDSAIVLNWLSSHPSRWTTFVANRVTQIQELSKMADWCKVDSKCNPADIVSRGMWPSELKNSLLWFKGPPFLQCEASQWPSQKPILKMEGIAELEERPNNVVLISNLSAVEDLVSSCKFANCFLKLNRVFSYIFRWVSNARLRLSGGSTRSYYSAFNVTELRFGLNYILFNVQQTSFSIEIMSINSDRAIKSSKMQKLNPFIDNYDRIPIVRVGGRLSNSELHFRVKHPVVLPTDHVFTIALATYLHKINSHAGPLALSAFIRQRFWILNARKVTRKVVRSCISCFKQRPRAIEQLMGDLPQDRVIRGSHPFQKVGMDFAGPISVHFKIRGKRPVKAYLALFICFLTKACHIEVVSDLSTPAFLCALKRFFARRGLSSDLYCDNATNFTGAARKLRELAQHFAESTVQLQIANTCAERGVNFHFIPPRSPHMGGLWESAIKVAKSMLVHHINGAFLTFEELNTVVIEIEAIMNSRPLYPMSSDPSDLEALTPGHFLIGRPLNCISEPFNEDELSVPPVNRWKRIQHIKQIFWSRWVKEYLTSLQERCKWRTTCANIQIGTLVLIAEDNMPPYKWLLGRIETVNSGNDGLVRVVSVRTSSGYVKRNIHKICPLPIYQ